MNKLSEIDKKTAAKGSGIETLWQFIKFTVVSLGTTIVQVTTLAVLYNIPPVKNLSTTAFHWFVFHYPVIEGERCGLALFIASNTANIIAQIFSFFVNKEKTFNSAANTKIVLPIYMLFTVGLICFSAWLNPVIFTLMINQFSLGSGLALTIATAFCSGMQFLLYFPVSKILFRKKKVEE